MTSPAVQVTGLRKTYDAKVAVDDVSFEVRAGEVFGILGPNGAGKSTTVESVAGLRVGDQRLLRRPGALAESGGAPRPGRADRRPLRLAQRRAAAAALHRPRAARPAPGRGARRAEHGPGPARPSRRLGRRARAARRRGDGAAGDPRSH